MEWRQWRKKDYCSALIALSSQRFLHIHFSYSLWHFHLALTFFENYGAWLSEKKLFKKHCSGSWKTCDHFAKTRDQFFYSFDTRLTFINLKIGGHLLEAWDSVTNLTILQVIICFSKYVKNCFLFWGDAKVMAFIQPILHWEGLHDGLYTAVKLTADLINRGSSNIE